MRYLTDTTGTVTDTYDYDAFGILIARTGTTDNNFLYCGEQFDPDLGFYYLRARYMNPNTGRFMSMDSFEGTDDEPRSIHKYTYCYNDVLNQIDRDGHEISMGNLMAAISIIGVLSNLSQASYHMYKAATARTTEEAVLESAQAVIYTALACLGAAGLGISWGGSATGGAMALTDISIQGSTMSVAAFIAGLAGPSVAYMSSGKTPRGSSGGGKYQKPLKLDASNKVHTPGSDIPDEIPKSWTMQNIKDAAEALKTSLQERDLLNLERASDPATPSHIVRVQKETAFLKKLMDRMGDTLGE